MSPRRFSSELWLLLLLADDDELRLRSRRLPLLTLPPLLLFLRLRYTIKDMIAMTMTATTTVLDITAVFELVPPLLDCPSLSDPAGLSLLSPSGCAGGVG
jgi:hypothetical protein